VTAYRAALLLHLVGVVLFFAGAAVAATGHAFAARRERPAEIALLLGLARAGVPPVVLGLGLVAGSGLWLVDLTGRSLGEPWLAASLALLAASLLLGAAGGRRIRHARTLAERLAAEAAESDELRRAVRDPSALALNYASAAAGLAVLVLMVWRPG
jgi:uncharacterized membrane protein